MVKQQKKMREEMFILLRQFLLSSIAFKDGEIVRLFDTYSLKMPFF